MRVYAIQLGFTALFFMFLLSSCGGDDLSGTLERTAPMNPDVLARASSGEEPEAKQQNPEQESEEDVQAAEQVPETIVEPGLVRIIVTGLETCRYGAVRCYVDRKYVGALDDEGRLEVTLEPGVYQGELVDSSGQWLFSITVEAGGTTNVALNCGGKMPFGEATLNSDEG